MKSKQAKKRLHYAKCTSLQNSLPSSYIHSPKKTGHDRAHYQKEVCNVSAGVLFILIMHN